MKHLKWSFSTEIQTYPLWLTVQDLAVYMLLILLLLLFGLTWISQKQTSSKVPWRTTLRIPRGVRALSCTRCLQPSARGKHKLICCSFAQPGFCYVLLHWYYKWWFNKGTAAYSRETQTYPVVAVSFALQISSPTISVKPFLPKLKMWAWNVLTAYSYVAVFTHVSPAQLSFSVSIRHHIGSNFYAGRLFPCMIP